MKPNELERLLSQLYTDFIQTEKASDEVSRAVHPSFKLSAKNLYRYLFLRQHDLRKVHDALSELGISSLRSSESYVLDNLTKSLGLLKLLLGKQWAPEEGVSAIGYTKGQALLEEHTQALFQYSDKRPFTEIMVTLPDGDLATTELITALAQDGMGIARMNLAHGEQADWDHMMSNIKKALTNLDRPFKIYMDLAGPKLRTGDFTLGKKERKENSIDIQEGDIIHLTRSTEPPKRVKRKKNGKIKRKGSIPVTLPEIISDSSVNDLIYFDDGMIEGVVIDKSEDHLEIEIKKSFKKKLRPNKGINLPKTRLSLPSLTVKDLEALPFVCEHADIVGYSFVRTAEDVDILYGHLDRLGAQHIGVVLKIENNEAFENLPEILLSAMKRERVGVMIARGDLAVEVGFERISEVQNEILWICEAAHLPVIWATQVLENLAKTGIPTRAEITDASFGAQAECVMLNKGEHILEALKALKNIISKMETHISKKKSTLRPLRVAKLFFKESMKS
jgi:pyruvate kinase